MKFRKLDKRFRLAKAGLAQFYFDVHYSLYYKEIHPLLTDTYGMGIRFYPGWMLNGISPGAEWYYEIRQAKAELFTDKNNNRNHIQLKSIDYIRVFLRREEQLTYLSLILK